MTSVFNWILWGQQELHIAKNQQEARLGRSVCVHTDANKKDDKSEINHQWLVKCIEGQMIVRKKGEGRRK